jgi:tetratricopeptide (TPR) repeat protein
LKNVERLDEALADYDRAISLKPDYAEARYNKALLLLYTQDYPGGFSLYRSRWDTRSFSSKRLSTNIPYWDGSQSTKKLLLWAEQGIGDEIFYSSMLSLIRGETSITLSADKRLHHLYERSFSGVSLLDRNIQTLPPHTEYDAQAAIGDLGNLLNLSAEIISKRRHPFLVVDAERRRELIAANDFLREKHVCGLAWRSSNRKFGREKSISLEDLAPLLGETDITFVNLQYGDVSEELGGVAESLGAKVHTADNLDVFQDIDGLLALIDTCNIVLTTSSVTAHLAGAIGKKAAVLVPSGKGRLWYWHDEPQSIWYPSLKLFSQSGNRDWSDPILQATKWIKDNIE